VNCRTCGADNPDDSLFCGACGAPVAQTEAEIRGVAEGPVRCTACGAQNAAGTVFCTTCRAVLSAPPPVPMAGTGIPSRFKPSAEHGAAAGPAEEQVVPVDTRGPIVLPWGDSTLSIERSTLQWVWKTARGWVAGLVAGFIAGIIVFFAVYDLLCATVLDTLALSLPVTVWLAIAGGLASTGQWQVLRRQVTHAGRWLLVSTITWATAGGWLGLAVVLADWISMSDSGSRSWTQVLAVTGICLIGIASIVIVGVAQGLALMGRTPGTRRWVLSSMWGWGSSLPVLVLGLVILLRAEWVHGDLAWPILLLILLLSGVMPGLATAGQATRLLQTPPVRPTGARRLTLVLAILWAVSLVLAVVIGLGLPGGCIERWY